jgi:anaerobic magnesium-protoporphyrin IX monomethyl ester cyclase
MKVLLVSPYTMEYVKRVDRQPSLALLHLAAALRQAGHEPVVLDLSTHAAEAGADHESGYVQHVITTLRTCDPGLVGLNCLLSEHFPFISRLSKAIKAACPSVPVVIGGIHPTLFATDILKNCQDIDVVVLGEGELQVVELAERFSRHSAPKLDDIESIAFMKENGEYCEVPRKSYITALDNMPSPAWDLVSISDYYTNHSTWYNPRNLDIKMSVPIMTSRSCPYDCNFCSIHYVTGRGLRLRNPVQVVDEMEMLYRTHGLNYFGFVDDNLTLNKSHIITICNEIIKRGMIIQFESINGYNLSSMDEEIVDAMVQAGCIYVILPIEHGCDRMRNEVIGKKLDREKIFQITELYKRHNLLTRGYFIMGFPEETPETLEETYRMILELQLDMNNVFNLIPFPGTRIFDQAMRDNLFLNEVDPGSLWEGTKGLNADNHSQFYIKPYNMTIGELTEYRHKFEDLRMLSDRAKMLQQGKKCMSKENN